MNDLRRWNVLAAATLPGSGTGCRSLPAAPRVEARFRGGPGALLSSARFGMDRVPMKAAGGREQLPGTTLAVGHPCKQTQAVPQTVPTFTTKSTPGPHSWRPPA